MEENSLSSITSPHKAPSKGESKSGRASHKRFTRKNKNVPSRKSDVPEEPGNHAGEFRDVANTAPSHSEKKRGLRTKQLPSAPMFRETLEQFGCVRRTEVRQQRRKKSLRSQGVDRQRAAWGERVTEARWSRSTDVSVALVALCRHWGHKILRHVPNPESRSSGAVRKPDAQGR